MSIEARHQKVFAWVMGEIGKVVSPGIGSWMPAWDATAEMVQDFMMTVLAWDGNDRNEGLRIQEKGVALIGKWKEVDVEYRKRVLRETS